MLEKLVGCLNKIVDCVYQREISEREREREM